MRSPRLQDIVPSLKKQQQRQPQTNHHHNQPPQPPHSVAILAQAVFLRSHARVNCTEEPYRSPWMVNASEPPQGGRVAGSGHGIVTSVRRLPWSWRRPSTTERSGWRCKEREWRARRTTRHGDRSLHSRGSGRRLLRRWPSRRQSWSSTVASARSSSWLSMSLCCRWWSSQWTLLRWLSLRRRRMPPMGLGLGGGRRGSNSPSPPKLKPPIFF